MRNLVKLNSAIPPFSLHQVEVAVGMRTVSFETRSADDMIVGLVAF